MIQRIEFWVSGEPKGQPRARAFSRNGHARMYNPKTAEHWKEQIAEVARQYLPKEPLDCPLCVSIQLFFPRPNSHYGTGKNARTLKPTAPYWHTGTPDRDNSEKAVTDALTIIGMWRDDSLICAGQTSKRYEQNKGPGAIITISEANHQ